MKGNQKAVFGQRIDIDIIGGIQRSAQKRGESVAHITEKALASYLSDDIELTPIERANYKKIGLEMQLNSIGSMLNVRLEGDIVLKIHTLIALCAGFDTIFPLREVSKTAKLSLFEAITDLKDLDKGLFDEIIPQLKRFRKLFIMFTQTTFGNEKV